jgi:hypothetical protein
MLMVLRPIDMIKSDSDSLSSKELQNGSFSQFYYFMSSRDNSKIKLKIVNKSHYSWYSNKVSDFFAVLRKSISTLLVEKGRRKNGKQDTA